MYKWYFLTLLLFGSSGIFSQQLRPLPENAVFRYRQDSDSIIKNIPAKLNFKKLVIPSAFIAYSFASLKIKELKVLNVSTRNELKEDHAKSTKVDNYTQFFPGLLAYGYGFAGIKGEHTLPQKTLIYATSLVISGSLVESLKHLIRESRPDSSDKYSFPSGHTTVAFASAQLLFMEYKNTNFWLSISGFPFAVYTAVHRVMNNKHWVGDVVAGAGFGIISTEIAYQIYPLLNHAITKKKRNHAIAVMPFYQSGCLGFTLTKSF